MTTPALKARRAILGIPTDPTKRPENQLLVEALDDMWGAMSASLIAGLVKLTRAELYAVPVAGVTAGGVVLDDPDPANNGFYAVKAGAWVKGRGFPDTVGVVHLSGSGSAQTGDVLNGVNPADVQIFFAEVTTPNTGPLRLSIAGVQRDVLNAAGNPLSPGEWTGGVMLRINPAGKFQLINEAGAAIAAARSATEADEARNDLKSRYLGPFANDTEASAATGGSHVAGQMYFNTTDGKFRVWHSGSWQDQSVSLDDGDVTEPKLAGSLTLGLEVVVTSRTSLASLNVSRWNAARLSEGGRSGLFDRLLISSLPTAEQAKVTADNAAHQGVYVVSSDDNLYLWKRRYSGPLMAEWFGAVPWVVGGSQDSTTAFQAAATFAGISGAWRWRGRHRLTSKITIPEHQVFGAFGNLTSIVPHIFATPATFIGVNTSVNADKIDNAVFFDALGVAFELGQAAEPQDFTIYGRGYLATDGSKNLNFPSSTTADWHGQVAFRYAKYIKPTNVSVVAFQIAYDSVAIGVNSGNYYSSLNGCSTEACCTLFQVGSTPSYNTEIHGGRWTCGRFGQFDTSVRNFKIFGGSIEGFSAVTYLRDDSEISFFGTYFETKNGGSLDQLFSTFHSRVIVNFIGCLVYMDNFKTLFGCATTSPSVVLNSHGNKFMVPEATNDTAASHIIYAMTSATVKGGSLFGDTIVKYGTSKTTTYVDGSTAAYVPFSAPTTLTV